MKKFLSVIMIVMMFITMVTPVFAAPTSQGIGLLKVLYSDLGKIKIDGNINASEWSEKSSIKLKCGTNMQTWTTAFPGEIQFFYSWNNDGFYIAAKISDSTLTLTSTSYGWDYPQDRFQIILNPCGLIYDESVGLMFTFYPICEDGTYPSTITSGRLGARKHCWEEKIDNQEDINEIGYEGAYTTTEYGWNMEAVIPWSLISSRDRIWDIIDYRTEGAFCSVFDPNNAEREKAFAEASISYIDCKEFDDSLPNTARTVNSSKYASDFSTASYDITFKFYKKGESTSNESVKDYTIKELQSIFKDVDWSDYKETEKATQPPVTNPPETDPPVTKPIVTQAPTTQAPITQPPITESPQTETLETDSSETDIPEMEIPATDAQSTDTEAVIEKITTANTKNNTKEEKDDDNDDDDDDDRKDSSSFSTVIVVMIVAIAIAIVAVSVAVVAIVIVLKKNKK